MALDRFNFRLLERDLRSLLCVPTQAFDGSQLQLHYRHLGMDPPHVHLPVSPGATAHRRDATGSYARLLRGRARLLKRGSSMLSVARPYYLRPPSNSGGRERGGSSSQSAAAYDRAVASSRSTSRNWSTVSGSRTSRDGDPHRFNSPRRRSLSSSRDSTYTRAVAENEILVLAY